MKLKAIANNLNYPYLLAFWDSKCDHAVGDNMCCLCCSRFSLTKKYYKERIDNAASYNSRLCSERKLRLPFLDSQTGVAQNHSNLWMLYRHRSPGKSDGNVVGMPHWHCLNAPVAMPQSQSRNAPTAKSQCPTFGHRVFDIYIYIYIIYNTKNNC